MMGLTDPHGVLPGFIHARLSDADLAEVGRHALNNSSRVRPEEILLLVGGLLTVLSLCSLVAWLSRQRLRPHTLVVFNRVAREAGLGLRDRLVLWRIARATALPTPLALLLCPGTLGHAARTYARHQRKRPGTLRLARAASIRRHLFGNPLAA